MSTPRILLGVTAAFLLAASGMRADSTISTAVTGRQTVSSGTLTVTTDGSVTSNNGDEAVRFTANNTGLINHGMIGNTAGGRAVRLNNDAAANVTLVNGATGIIRSQSDDAFQVSASGAASNVSLTNSGLIEVTGPGGQAVDWNNILTGSNVLTNNAGGIIRTVGADAVRPGMNGVVNNHGTISGTLVMQGGGTVDSSDGIDFQDDRSGGIVNNFSGGLIEGRHGITGGAVTNPDYTLAVNNAAGGVIRGLNGAGINIDGLFTTAVTTVVNSGIIEGKWDGVSLNGDGDGVDVDGVANITNHGVIRALSAAGVGSDGLTNTADAIAIGGGTVDNKADATISSVGRGILVDNSSQGNALAALTLTNAGTITAGNGAAVGVVGTIGNTVTNSATGAIAGGNALQAAIELGSGADTVNNAGEISAANGATHAIRLGGGDDTLNITGGSITGVIDGGDGVDTVNFTLGADASYAASAAISNIEIVNVNGGTVVVGSAAALGSATVTVAGGTLDLNGVAVTNAITLSGGKLSGASGYTGALAVSGDAAVSGAFGGEFDTGTDSARVIDTTGGATFTGTLKGRGVFSGGMVTILGVHAVGNSPGMQTFAGGVTYGADSVLEWEFAGDSLLVRGGDYDAVNVTGGNAVITNGAVWKILNLSGVDYSGVAWDADRSFLVLDASGALAFVGEFALDVSGAGATAGQGEWSLEHTEGGVTAKWTASAVPEPSTYGLLGAGAALFAARLRRRRRAA